MSKKDNIINLEEYQFTNSPKFKSNELLEEAFEAETINKALKLAKQALEIYPNNLDAEAFIIENEKSLIKRLKKYDELLVKATKLLEEENMFDEENIGAFWGILETRPYMRIRYNRLLLLKELGRFTEVIKEGEDMIRLCSVENLGVRHILLGAYCILEKFEECEAFYKKCVDRSAYMTLPMAVMYFKKGDYKKSKQFLKKTDEENVFVLDFLLEGLEYETSETGYYSYGSEEEAFFILHDFLYLVASNPLFLEFVVNEYRK